MQKFEFIASKDIDLTKAIINELPILSRYDIKKILQDKDIKVNGVRVKENKPLSAGDKIVVYYTEKEQKKWYNIVYCDNNVLIVNKRAGIEVVSEADRDLQSVLIKDGYNVKPVHRLDRNTEGLVIFALNEESEESLNNAFKSRNEIIKKYALFVHGRVDLSKIKRTMYLKKVDTLSKVWLSEVKTSGYEPIITEFDVVQYLGNNTLMEAKLVTGKTHQIRAHIAYFGHAILGDQKYGKDEYKVLHLTANSLAFNFKKGNCLSYLNNKNFEIIPSWLK